MATADVFTLQGSIKGSVELPQSFGEAVRDDIIRRAVLAEETLTLQPQGHYLLAGMQTSARYYGAMNSYRGGRKQGVAMRPRQKLGGGRQGDVRTIPSSVKGRRAHPHRIEKTLIEQMNRKEYQKAVRSSIAATAKAEVVKGKHSFEGKLPLVVTDDIESIKRTKDLVKIFDTLKLSKDMESSHKSRLRKGLRRSSKRRSFRKTVLLVVGEDKGVINAGRNIPGVDVCTARAITVSKLAPGGVPGRITLWSESALKKIDSEVQKLSLKW
jgi:large subunit ribosomal protein L4e